MSRPFKRLGADRSSKTMRERDIVRIELPVANATSVVLFLKRNLRPARKHVWSFFHFGGRYRSASDLEWANLRRLEAAGVNVSAPVAVGSTFGPVGERFSFLVTEAAPGIAFDRLLADERCPIRRRAAIRSVARCVRRIHAAGYSVPGMYARHLFVDLDDNARTTIIDIDRCRSIKVKRDPIANELSLLHLSVPNVHASRRERLRLLREYLGGHRIDRDLLTRIEALIAFHRARKPSLAAAFDRASTSAAR